MFLNTEEIREVLSISATKFSCSCFVGAVNLNEYKTGIFRGKIIFVIPVKPRHNSSKREAVSEDGPSV